MVELTPGQKANLLTYTKNIPAGFSLMDYIQSSEEDPVISLGLLLGCTSNSPTYFYKYFWYIVQYLGLDPIAVKQALSKARSARTKRSLSSRLGVDNISQLKEVQKKKEDTFQKHYGTKNIFNSEPFLLSSRESFVRDHLPSYLADLKNKDLTLLSSVEDLITSHSLRKNGTIKVQHNCGYTYEGRFPNKPDFRLCPACYKGLYRSRQEDYVKSLMPPDTLTSYRALRFPGARQPFELDLYSPSAKLAVECNGYMFHQSSTDFLSCKKKPRTYHQLKSQVCLSQGIRLLHLWEDCKPEFVASLIRRQLKQPSIGIFARKCSLIEDKTLLQAFIQANHYQGDSSAADYWIGLAYNGEVVAAMSFKHYSGLVYNTRYCTHYSYNVVGGFNRLIKNAVLFIKEKWSDVNKIVTHCNRDFSPDYRDTVYYRNGWVMTDESAPQLRYYDKSAGRIYPRDHFMKKRLSRYWLDVDLSKTEQAICLEHDVYQVYNSGAWKFELEI